MGRRLTEQIIKKLKAPEEGNRIEWDGEISGFGARITASGALSFVLDYRIFGRQRRYTVGRWPEWTATAARDEALALKKKIRENIDPLEEKNRDRSEPTLTDLKTEYLERYAAAYKRPSSVRDDRRMLEKIIVPKLGKMRIAAIGKRDIEKLHSSLKKTPYQANRVLALLSKMFSLAIEWEYATTNPARKVPRFQEGKRERSLSVEEVQRFREALDSYGNEEARSESAEKRNTEKRNAANALRLLMLTGSREGEVLKAEWEQFDLERGVWTKPAHFTKQKRTEHIPLSKPALKLLERMMLENPTGPLFPGADGGARVSLRRPWVQACKAAGLVDAVSVKGKRRTITKYRPTLRIHDLRHNFASHLASEGVSLQIVGKLLGHTQAATTMRYAHLQDEALRAATNRFGAIYTDTGTRKTGTRA